MSDRTAPDEFDKLSQTGDLFAEYLERTEAGESVDLDALFTRAGEHRDSLAARIRAYAELVDLRAELVEPSSVQEPPREFGNYRLLETLGRGGLSRVYVADDPKLRRRIALKILDPNAVHASDSREWIRNEGRSLARLEHPSIVHVYEIGEFDGITYIAMERVIGVGLDRAIGALRGDQPSERESVRDAALAKSAAEALRSIPARCRLVIEVADALAYSHEHGVVHRDVKPANILFDVSGRPRLIDFGLAHLESEEASRTRITARLMGTAAYIAPEQVDRGSTGSDPRSDQFALGIVLYELLTLHHPFDLGTRSGTLEAVSRCEVPRPRALAPAIPEDLERIVLHCLERDPAARYPNLRGLADDLRAFLELRAISLPAPTSAAIARAWLRRHARQVAIAAICLVALVALIVGQGLIRDLADERSLLERLAAASDKLARAADPPQFMASLVDLQNLERERVDLEHAALIVRWKHAARDASVAARVSASRRIHDEIDRLERESLQLGIHVDFGLWQAVLDADAAQSPDPSINAPYRDRGSVQIGGELARADVRLYRWQRANALESFVLMRQPLTLRPPNDYARYTFWDPATHEFLAEHERLFDSSDPRLTFAERQPIVPLGCELAFVEVDADAARAELAELRPMRDSDRSPAEREQSRALIESPNSVANELVAPCSAVWLSAKLVSWRDMLDYAAQFPADYSAVNAARETWSRGVAASYRMVFGHVDHPSLPPPVIDDDSPAIVSADIARRFAFARGMRLPTAAEVLIARCNDSLVHPTVDSFVRGEICSTPSFGDDARASAIFEIVGESPHDNNDIRAGPRVCPVEKNSPMTLFDSKSPILFGAGFRLARSARAPKN